MSALRQYSALLAALVGLGLCGGPAAGAAGATTAPRVSTSGPRAPAKVLPFIEDDYNRAIAEAKSRQVPLFIESWAPW